MSYKQYERYRVYDDGRVYSEISNKFLKPDIDSMGYEQVTLATENGPFRVKVHRLVAKMFIPYDSRDDIHRGLVNHKDGNKRNNSVTNLEWCTADENNRHARDTGLNNVSKSNSERWKDPEFRKRTSEKFSKIKIESGLSKGRKNGRFRYSVVNSCGKELSREEVSRTIKRCQSFTDACIRRAANEHLALFESHGLRVYDTKKS